MGAEVGARSLLASQSVNRRILCLASLTLLLGVGLGVGCRRGHETIAPEVVLSGEQAEVAGIVAEPYIMDWRPEDRQSLEQVMLEQVAVVAYDAGQLRLLRDCRVAGRYTFTALTGEKSTLTFREATEVALNLPLNGSKIAAEIGAGFEQGAFVEVVYYPVGKLRTAWNVLARDELEGSECELATHFVVSAAVGAFSMESHSAVGGGGTVKVASAQLDGQRSAERRVLQHSGDFAACEAVEPGSSEMPARCRAMMRLELREIRAAESDEGSSDAGGESGDEDAITVAADGDGDSVAGEVEVASGPCPQGYVMSAGVCARPQDDRVHTCVSGDETDCSRQCEAGDAGSCEVLATMHLAGVGVSEDLAKAESLYALACDGGSAEGCYQLGHSYRDGWAGAVDLGQAKLAWQTGCDAGHGRSCEMLATVLLEEYDAAAPDPSLLMRAAMLFDEGCDLGHGGSCSTLGVYYLSGTFFEADPVRAAELFERACQAGVAAGCENLGYLLEFGRGLTANPERAVSTYRRSCRLADGGCVPIGAAHQTGTGVEQDLAAASRYFRRACDDGYALGCAARSVLVGEGHNQSHDQFMGANLQLWTDSCKQGIERDCTQLGLMEVVGGQSEAGLAHLGDACKLGDAWGCDLLERAQ